MKLYFKNVVRDQAKLLLYFEEDSTEADYILVNSNQIAKKGEPPKSVQNLSYSWAGPEERKEQNFEKLTLLKVTWDE